MAFGSRFISEGEVFDYLPESVLPRVKNVAEFAGLFALERWLCNCDSRQAVFCRPKSKRKFRAHFIDFGYCFNAKEWNFTDSPLRGICAKTDVYRNITGWHSFEPWLSGIESFPLIELRAIAEELPPEWIDPDLVKDLVDRIESRRNRLRELIAKSSQVHTQPIQPMDRGKAMTLKFWKYLVTNCNGAAICIVADQDRKCAEKELGCDPHLLCYIAQPQFECSVFRCPAHKFCGGFGGYGFGSCGFRIEHSNEGIV